jgi:hypothetical protein
MKSPSPYSYPGANPMHTNPRPGQVTVDPRAPVVPAPVTPLQGPMQTPASPLYPVMPGSPRSPNVRPL